MAVFLAFSEPQDVPGFNSAGLLQTTTGVNAWTRRSFNRGNETSACTISAGADRTEGWLHFRYTPRSLASGGFTGFPIALVGQNGTTFFGVWNSSNSVGMGYSGTMQAGVIRADSTGTVDIDIHFRVHATTGFVYLYRDGVLYYSFEGNTALSGITSINQLKFDRVASSSGNISTTAHLSEILFSDEPTIGARVITLDFTAAGAVQEWTGAVGDINAFNSPDTSFINTATAGAITTYLKTAMPSILPAETITGLVLNVRANAVPGSPVTNLTPVLRTGGTNFAQSTIGLANIAAGYSRIFDTNPTGGGALWTAAAIDALELGWRADA